MASTSAFPYDDIVERLTVRHIQTPVDRLVGSPDDPVEEVRRVLKKNHFDFGPIFRGGELVGRIGLTQIANHTGPVADRFEPLRQDFLVSSASSIRSVMKWFTNDPWLLVVDGRQITGLATPSDLKRQAARAYFYLLVADFEIRLADAIRNEFEDQEEIFAFLEEYAIRETKKNLAKAGKGDIDSDLVAAMYLLHMVTVATKAAGVRARLDHITDEDWEWASRQVNEFRIQVMHPSKPLLDETSGLERLIRLEERLRRLAGDGSEARVMEGAA